MKRSTTAAVCALALAGALALGGAAQADARPEHRVEQDRGEVS